jgi:endonuclease YncB( thermonuclease family)
MASRYTLIKGSFPIVGTEPDGDTLRFQPDTPALVETLGPAGQAPGWSHDGTQISVRFEAIDALETHFQGTRQQVRLGDLATQVMLHAAGFSAVRTSGTRVTSAVPPAVRGHVAANGLDSYGRMIAFVFAGEAAGADGEPLFLDPPLLAASVNAQLLAQGLAYPAFYTTLPTDLKDHLAAETRVIRERALGLWPEDAPSLERTADIADLAAAESLAMWPKLFRRLVAYFQVGNAGLGGLDAWLRQDLRNRDDYLQLPNGELGNMHDLVEVSGNRMRLRFRPEDLVVLPDTFVPEPVPAPGPAPAPQPVRGAVRLVAALPNPIGTEKGHETVTLINTGAAAVDLTGWQVRDRQLQAAAKPGTGLSGTLAPGETLRVPLQPPVTLANSGDDLFLLDGSGTLVDQASYTRTEAGPGVTVLFTKTSP